MGGFPPITRIEKVKTDNIDLGTRSFANVVNISSILDLNKKKKGNFLIIPEENSENSENSENNEK